MSARRVLALPLVPRTPPITRTIFQVPYNPVEEAQTPVELDPSYLRLWKDVDSSIKRHKKKEPVIHNDAEVLDVEPASAASGRMAAEELEGAAEGGAELSERFVKIQWKRKSREARIGSDKIGQYALPFELQRSMERLIAENKEQIRSDAKRLLLQPSTAGNTSWGNQWTTEMPKYKRAWEERVMGPREGLAYAAIALPPHIVAIKSVLHQLRVRMPRGWNIKNVINFGSQTGAGFWATLTFFGNAPAGWEGQETAPSDTTLSRYIALENRTGLQRLGKTVMSGIDTGSCTVTHRDFWSSVDKATALDLMSESEQTIVLCAFTISQLSSAAARKRMVEEIWGTGADVMIIIDHGNQEGFRAVTDARESLIRIGSKQGGSHVVAPCPHDGSCPLRLTSDVCVFPQRFTRPAFLRKTKHAKRDFEDVTYSYVVIRRGERPFKPLLSTGPALDEMKGPEETAATGCADHIDGEPGEPVSKLTRLEYSIENERQEAERIFREQEADQEELERLKQESYHWRRIIYNPMKGSGHITMDTCTSKGEIARIVIPRSQGKQAYYDARKSAWGDLFPHDPKNGEVIRERGIRRLKEIEGTSTPSGPEGEKEDVAMDSFLRAMGVDGTKRKGGKERVSKLERREAHRQRKEWRKNEGRW